MSEPNGEPSPTSHARRNAELTGLALVLMLYFVAPGLLIALIDIAHHENAISSSQAQRVLTIFLPVFWLSDNFTAYEVLLKAELALFWNWFPKYSPADW